MQTETRKLILIEEILKIRNKATLAELESIINKAKQKEKKKPLTVQDFIGVWTKKEAALITKAIEESCAQIDEGDWK